MFKTILISLAITFISFQGVYAYTNDEVSSHNTPSDCWVVFEEKVYDLTEYLNQHDVYLDIREWCGLDMTQDFITKAGIGIDHKYSSYSLLEQYYIGDITDEQKVVLYNDTQQTSVTNDTSAEKKVVNSNPYNLVVPLLLSISLYWIPYIMIKKSNPGGIKKFNAFWNSVLIFLLVVPALGFGIYMILRYKVPSLWNTNFNFMYWHVELSLAMGILGINHFLQRLKIYFSQVKKN